MTGTLLDTSEGNVIQAQANLTMYGVQGIANLVMSVDSPMAKAITTLDKEMSNELYLMPFDIKCFANKLPLLNGRLGYKGK